MAAICAASSEFDRGHLGREQTEHLSLPTQLRACEEYCRREGFEIVQRFKEEGESAKTADRTELQRLLAYCRTNKGKVQFVVVFSLDPIWWTV